MKTKLMKDNQPFQMKGFGIIIVVLYFFQISVYGQEPESVAFTTPKTLYFTGEKVWIDASVRLSSEASPSQVLYVELIDGDSRSLAYTMIPLVEGKAVNFLSLSDQLPSANYLLRVYTRVSPYLDLNTGVAQQLITVINPSVPPRVSTTSKKGSAPWSGTELPEVRTSEALALLTREISTGSEFAGISIANPFLSEEQASIPSSIYASLKSKPILPELFGHILEVKVPSPDTTLTYFLSVHGKQSALYTAHPDQQGAMYFDIGGLKHWDKIILQLENGQEMPGLAPVDPVIETTFKADFKLPELVLDESDLEFLTQWLKASRVETLFTERYQEDSVQIVTGFVADYSYNLDDYTRFETVETVIREYVPSAAVRTRDRRKEFRLLNQANNSVFDANPLILIDAMPVFDSDLLSVFNPKQIQTLEVLNREFYLNDRTYPGVLSFSSYQNNFGLYPLAPNARFFDYVGLRPWIDLDRAQFSRKIEEKHVPDWRSIWLWRGKGEETPQISLPETGGVFVIWEKMKSSSGEVQVRKRYFRYLD